MSIAKHLPVGGCDHLFQGCCVVRAVALSRDAVRAILMAAGTDANRHLIAGLLQKLTIGECRLVLGLPFALEADWAAPLGGCAET